LRLTASSFNLVLLRYWR